MHNIKAYHPWPLWPPSPLELTRPPQQPTPPDLPNHSEHPVPPDPLTNPNTKAKLITLIIPSTKSRSSLPTWPIRPPKYSDHSDHPTTFNIPTPNHLDHTKKRTSGTTIKKLSKTTVFKLVGRKCPERQFAKYAICWSRNMIIFEHLIQNDHLQRSCPSQHQSCSERKFPKKICPQNLQKFTEMIRNNNLQIRFTEPHYEKISRTIACKNVSTETICQKKKL